MPIIEALEKITCCAALPTGLDTCDGVIPDDTVLVVAIPPPARLAAGTLPIILK